MSSVNIAAAVTFNRRVQTHPKLLARYQQLMSLFANGKLDIPTLDSELKDLFQSHQDLLHGIRWFLPSQYHQPTPMQVSRKKSSNFVSADMGKLSRCIEFMNKLKKRFPDERGINGTFLETLKAFSKGKLSEKELYVGVTNIFGDENPDLVDEFESILGTRDRKKVKEKKLPTPVAEERIMEDGLFELDVHLSQVKTALESAKRLTEILRDNSNINIDNYFSAVSLGRIRKECKKEGFAIIKRLREDPKGELPQILLNLELRQMELLMSREKMDQRCRAIHHKKQRCY